MSSPANSGTANSGTISATTTSVAATLPTRVQLKVAALMFGLVIAVWTQSVWTQSAPQAVNKHQSTERHHENEISKTTNTDEQPRNSEPSHERPIFMPMTEEQIALLSNQQLQRLLGYCKNKLNLDVHQSSSLYEHINKCGRLFEIFATEQQFLQWLMSVQDFHHLSTSDQEEAVQTCSVAFETMVHVFFHSSSHFCRRTSHCFYAARYACDRADKPRSWLLACMWLTL